MSETDTPQKNRRDEPLTSEDLRICNDVLKALSREHRIEKGKAAVTRLAAIIIELYRQGVREAEQLAMLAGATRE
ncbi:hypothetical protein HGP14_33620 [Rhizobium sp. P32RR-XVIII]|uniref:hypothetical protein n=1 Tax=Rhizobium sp. P32RR-XVIII TaxID=2726738 RepID=UPI0014572DAE|nr:hypothetical protein [Rhizobium sp. P32RR-XVIII]NLS08136.1 hypothetical protein [Rhizobium sp. P32RR-XVIII]